MNVYTALLGKIKNGQYVPGQQLPGTAELCAEYDCSEITIKKAMNLLVNDDLIERKPGVGTLVKDQGLLFRMAHADFSDLGGDYKDKREVTNDIISFTLEFADPEVAKMLEIKAGDPIYTFTRLRYLRYQPYCIEKNHIPVSRIPGLTQEILKGSLFSYIEDTLQLTIAGSIRKAKADLSNSEDRQYLALRDSEPVLQLEIVSYLADGKPFEYSISRHRYDMFTFTSVYIPKKAPGR